MRNPADGLVPADTAQVETVVLISAANFIAPYRLSECIR